jgi:hypothetical protein
MIVPKWQNGNASAASTAPGATNLLAGGGLMRYGISVENEGWFSIRDRTRTEPCWTMGLVPGDATCERRTRSLSPRTSLQNLRIGTSFDHCSLLRAYSGDSVCCSALIPHADVWFSVPRSSVRTGWGGGCQGNRVDVPFRYGALATQRTHKQL